MVFHLYNVVWYLFAPFLKIYLRNSKYVDLLERFSPSPKIRNPVWLHTCSVGEVNLVFPLIRLWKEYYPDKKLLLTTSTITGFEQAKKRYDSLCDEICFSPFDHPKVVKDFFNRVKPSLLILTETEIWPNIILRASRENVPVVIINGRLSDKAYGRYKNIKWIIKEVFEKIDFVYAQTEEYAGRFRSLGVSPDKVQVVGNMKYDSISTEVSPSIKNEIRMDLNIPNGDIVVVFGSMREGDEIVARLLWDYFKEKKKNLWLILVPRHPEKKDKILGVFEDENIFLRSESLEGIKKESRIVVVDTIGELVNFYSIATVAIIGGSWFPGVEGHNPLEPAGLGVVPVWGRYMRNFQESAEKLIAGGGAIQVDDYHELPNILERLLSSGEYINLGTKAREVVLKNQGVSRKIISHIKHFL